jgi:hypothetical protein
MSRATRKIREFAQRLIDHETRSNSSATKTAAACVVCDKLRPHLATLMGTSGFRVLLSRAMALSNAEASWLRAVRIKTDGSLEGFDEPAAQVDPEEFAEGIVVLVTQLLGLLVAFIGENLTVHLVREVWPKMPLPNLHSGDRGKK